MKKTMMAVAFVAMTLVSCGPSRVVSDPKEPGGYWEELIPYGATTSGLWRYVDRENGVVIYVGNNGRMAAVKMEAQ